MRKSMFKSVVAAVVLAAMVGLSFGCAPHQPHQLHQLHQPHRQRKIHR